MLTIPKMMMDSLGWKPDDWVVMDVADGRVTITRTEPPEADDVADVLEGMKDRLLRMQANAERVLAELAAIRDAVNKE